MARRSAACGLAAALASTAVAGSRADAQQLEPIRYVLRIPAPETHYIEVQATYPTSRKPAIELMMPVWTPGSYLVREFARHVEEVRARDPAGHALHVGKSRKNRWRVETGRSRRRRPDIPRLRHERQARTNWVEDSFALINGAPTYITLVERVRRPHEVTLELRRRMVQVADVVASGRRRSTAPLPRPRLRHPGRLSDPGRQSGRLRVRGRRHAARPGQRRRGRRLGRRPLGPRRRSASCGQRVSFWGVPAVPALPLLQPADRESAAASSTRNSTVLMASRWSTRTDRAYLDWLNTGQPTSSSTPGTSSASARSSSARSTTRTRSTPEPLGRRRAHRLLRAGCWSVAQGWRHASETLADISARHRPCCRPRPDGSYSRSSSRRTTPGSSSTAATRTRPTPR